MNEPFSCPNSSLSSSVSASAAHETATNGPPRAVARVVDRPRHQFLARPALALDQHRAAQARHVPRQLEDLHHARALADDVLEAVLLRQLLAQDGVLALQVLDLDDAAHQQRDLLRVARLDDVLLRALLHGGDGGIHGGIRGDDDDGGVRMHAPDLHHGFDAVHAARHLEIDEVDGVVLGPRVVHGFAAGGRRIHRIAVLAQPRGQRFAHHFFIVDNQNFPVTIHDAFRIIGIFSWSSAAQPAQ